MEGVSPRGVRWQLAAFTVTEEENWTHGLPVALNGENYLQNSKSMTVPAGSGKGTGPLSSANT